MHMNLNQSWHGHRRYLCDWVREWVSEWVSRRLYYFRKYGTYCIRSDDDRALESNQSSIYCIQIRMNWIQTKYLADIFSVLWLVSPDRACMLSDKNNRRSYSPYKYHTIITRVVRVSTYYDMIHNKVTIRFRLFFYFGQEDLRTDLHLLLYRFRVSFSRATVLFAILK